MAVKNTKKNINGKDSEVIGKIRLNTNKTLNVIEIRYYFICIFFLFFSCTTDESKHSETKMQPDDIQLTEKICTDFAVKIHTALVNSDSTFLNSYLDWSSLEGDNSLNDEILQHVKSQYWLETDLMSEIKNGAHLKFITYYKEANRHYIILRQYVEPQTVNYLEIEMGTDKNSMVIKDIYDFNSASHYSNWIENFATYYNSKGNEWQLVLHNNEYRADSIFSELNKGNIKEAYLMLNDFDADYRNTAMFRQLNEQIILQSQDPKVVITYLSQKLQNIPIGAKGRWLSMFYYNAFKGNYADGLIALTNLEEEVGEDGVINFLKGNMYFELENYATAIEEFNLAITYNPNISTFHFAKVYAQIEMDNYESAVESLLVLDDYFDVKQMNWDEEFASYSVFIQSDAYKKWLERLEN